MIRFYPLPWLLVVVICSAQNTTSVSTECEQNTECGWNSVCHQGACRCQSGHNLSSNMKDCVTADCVVPGCLNCSQDKKQCTRCINFLERDTGRCLDICGGSYVFTMQGTHLGKVCIEPVIMDEELKALYIAVTVGVCCGFILTLLLGILFYWRMKKMRNDFSFVISKGIRNLQIKEMENGQTKELFGYDNKAFEPDYHISEGSARFEFKKQLTELRPHTDTLTTMLSEARSKMSALNAGSQKIYIYKNVIHQLSRVLTLLKTPENMVMLPADGQALLTWASQILAEYQKINSSTRDFVKSSGVHKNLSNGHLVTLHQNGHVANFCESVTNNNYKDPCSTFRYQKNSRSEDEHSDISEQSADDSCYSDLNVIHLLDDLTEPIEV